MENWIKSDTADSQNVILSSRIRLARNINKIPFPYRLNENGSKSVVKEIEDAFYSSDYNKDNFNTIYMWDKNPVEQKVYLEKHLISDKLLSNNQKSAFIVNKDETVSVMINEEDHIRLQCITAGLNLLEAYDSAQNFDDLIEEKVDYAFDEKLGYLTACPTNLGTGLRASVMLHLPVLTANGEMNQVLNAVAQVGMTVRGLYGEGSKALGYLYQISNQVTLGLSEADILNNLTAIVSQIVNEENTAREQLLKRYKYEVEDRVFRSLGLLKSAVILSTQECMYNLSNVRMGVEMGIIKGVSKGDLNSLLIDVQPASLQKSVGERLNERERDIKRAELVRQKLK